MAEVVVLAEVVEVVKVAMQHSELGLMETLEDRGDLGLMVLLVVIPQLVMVLSLLVDRL